MIKSLSTLGFYFDDPVVANVTAENNPSFLGNHIFLYNLFIRKHILPYTLDFYPLRMRLRILPRIPFDVEVIAHVFTHDLS